MCFCDVKLREDDLNKPKHVGLLVSFVVKFSFNTCAFVGVDN